MKFSLCIEPVFEELPFYERFKVAKELGCDAVEFWDTGMFIKYGKKKSTF